MKILSLYPYTHISSSALLINGKIVAAACEERFNREKMSTKFPEKSARWCLKVSGLDFDDLDLIVVPWNPQINVNNASNRWINDLRWRGEMFSNIPIHLMKMIDKKPSNFLEVNWGTNKIKYLNHHDCHAAFGFFQSSFKDADILTIDGHGEEETCFIGTAKDKKIKKILSIKYPHSVGLFYGTFTDFLGFKPDSDEWKAMALSSYSKSLNKYDKIVSKLYNLTKNGFELNLSFFNYYTFDRKKNFFSEKFKTFFGNPRLKDNKIKQNHFQIAAAMQRHFELIVKHLIKITKRVGSSKNLVIGGGAAMNCVFNGKLDDMNIYKDTHISYAPDDSGVAIGAALLAYNLNSKKVRKINEIKTCFFGPEYKNNEIIKILKNNKISFYKPKNLSKEIALQISSGKLVGWFQDKMEFGHRALGNRSILADPRNPKVKNIVNRAIKFRESFRPFAPAILEEYCTKIMNMPIKRKVFFMERAYKFKKKWFKKIPGVVHEDKTGRLQTVSKSTNEKFYRLIEEFYKITKVPVLLNTSFNLNGEPIVMTPNDAIRTFYNCGLDILVLGDLVIEKQK
mgnify:CR=1 FL=1